MMMKKNSQIFKRAFVCVCLLVPLLPLARFFPPAAAHAAVYGDALVMGSLADASNLIPAISTDSASHEISEKLFIGLLKYDENLNIVPQAAKSFQVLDNGLRLRFELRDDIFWEDGKPLTLDDVEFTYRMIIDPATGSAYSSALKQVKEFRRLGERSFEVTYDAPFARALISWMTEIMPKHLLEGQDVRRSEFMRMPKGCGPFKLQSRQPGSRITLGANPAYFEGRPYLDGLVYKIIPDITTMFMELRAGALDYMGLTPQQFVFQMRKSGLAAQEDARLIKAGPNAPADDFFRRFSCYRQIGASYTYMGYNLKNPLFSDARVRRALSMAIDKKEIIKGALLGQGVPTQGPYPPTSWAFDAQLAPYPYDLAAATALLQECGWEKDAKSGLLMKNGQPFSFTLLISQGNEVREKTAIIIQSQLRKLGVDVKIRVVEWTTLLREFVDKNRFEALIMAWTTPPDPDAYDVWHSSKTGNGGLNFVGYSNPEVDRLLEEGRATFDQEKRREIYRRFQEILHEDQPYCFLFVPYAIAAIDSRVQGIEPAPAGIEYNLIRWWVPEARQRHKALMKP